MISPYRVLDRKRSGERLSEEEIREAVGAAVDGSWSDAQLAAFLMASAIRGLDGSETRMLTSAMLARVRQSGLAERLLRWTGGSLLVGLGIHLAIARD